MRAAVGLLAALLLLPAGALGQCSMCREAARSQREEAVAALNSAILFLGAPVALILAGLGRVVVRRIQRDEE